MENINSKITLSDGRLAQISMAVGRGVDPEWITICVDIMGGYYPTEDGKMKYWRDYSKVYAMGRNPEDAKTKYESILKR